MRPPGVVVVIRGQEGVGLESLHAPTTSYLVPLKTAVSHSLLRFREIT